MRHKTMQYQLFLSKTEKDVLYKKYRSCGLDPTDANQRIKDFQDHLHKLACKLTKQNKSKEHIQERFLKEFYNLCQKLEV